MHLPRLIFLFIAFIKTVTCCSQETADYYIQGYKAEKKIPRGSFVFSLGNTTSQIGLPIEICLTLIFICGIPMKTT